MPEGPDAVELDRPLPTRPGGSEPSRDADRPRLPGRAGVLVAGVWRGAIASRVEEGRLRDVDWPYGLRAVVIAVCALSSVAGLLAILSSWLRRIGTLTVPSTLGSSTPDDFVWVLTFLMVFALALFHTATLHSPWWLRTIGLVLTTGLLGIWGLRGVSAGESVQWSGISVGIIVAVVVITLVRMRRPFAWWEFPVFLGLMGAGIASGLAGMGSSARFLGFELAPAFLQQTLGVLGFVVLPAAVAAGTSVAEITVAGTLIAVRQADRLPGRRWPFLILGLVVAGRVAQSGWDVTHLDPVRQGWLAFGPALVLIGLFAAVALVLLRLARTRSATSPAHRVTVSELPDELARLSLPISAALVAVLLPILVLLLALQVVVSLNPTGALGRISLNLSPILDHGAEAVRLALGVVLLILAVLRARQGRRTTSILFGSIGVVLVGYAMRLITGDRWAIWFDPDVVNLVATGVALVLIASYAIRRRLTRHRALAATGLLVLSALFSNRDFVSDPVAAIVGYSGVALVLFGVAWDFLTGSNWANNEGRRFSRPTRVLLLLTNTMLIMAMLAYSSLVRDPDSAINLDSYAELGNLILGTGLLAAAFVVVVHLSAADRPVT